MSPFNRLPGSRRAPSGMEWTVLKKVPAAMFGGACGCAAMILLLQSGWLGISEEAALRAQFSLAGLLLSYLIITATLALGCVIVVVMKGHAYVRDPYYLPPEREGQFERNQD